MPREISPEILNDPEKLLQLFEKSSPKETAYIIQQYFRSDGSDYYKTLMNKTNENNLAYLCSIFIKKDPSLMISGFFPKTEDFHKAFKILENEKGKYPQIKKNLELMLCFKQYAVKHANASSRSRSNFSVQERRINVTPGSYANLRTMQLIDAVLESQDLQAIDFENTHFSNVNFTNSDLRDVNLKSSNLTKVNFLNTDLRNANLSHVNCYGVNLTNANLENADLSYLNFGKLYSSTGYSVLNTTNLVGANLKGTRIEYATLKKVSFFNKAILTNVNAFEKELTRLHEMLQDNPDIARFREAIVNDITQKAVQFKLSHKEKLQLHHKAYNHPLLQHRHFRIVKDTINSIYASFFGPKNKTFQRVAIETHSQERLSRKMGVW